MLTTVRKANTNHVRRSFERLRINYESLGAKFGSLLLINHGTLLCNKHSKSNGVTIDLLIRLALIHRATCYIHAKRRVRL